MNYLYYFLLALGLGLVVTKFVLSYAKKNNIALPKIRERDVHKKPVPRIGGVALFLVFWIIVFTIYAINPNNLKFVDEKIFGIDKNLLGLFFATLTWVIAGIVDDTKGLKPAPKLIVQFICGLIIAGFGIKIWWVSNPFGGANIVLESLTYLLVPVWIVLLMNTLNWFDGIDGLTSSISLISLLVLFGLSISDKVNQLSTGLLCIVLAGAVLAFLFFNWNPAKIFLGDSGSGFLGLCIAVFAIISGAKIATAFLVLGIPIIDTVVVVVTRLVKRKSIFAADKSHLHHRFLAAGFSVKQTVVFLSLISVVFGYIALISQTKEKMQAVLYLVLLMGIILLSLFIINKRNERKKEHLG